jgi:DNA polymerase sigma
MANKAFPGSRPVLKLFGSLMTGLALETSDMDIAVTGLRIEDRMAMIDDLHALEDEIKKWPIIKDLKSIDTASIPVIKANLSMKAVAKEMLKAFSEDMVDIDLPIDITFDDTPIDFSDTYRLNTQEKPFYQTHNQIGQNYSPAFGTDYRQGSII